MNAVFRVDASVVLGTGHVVRCLTLANALRDRGVEASFVCRLHDGHACDLVTQAGFEVECLPLTARYGAAAGAVEEIVLLGASWQRDAEETFAAIGGGEISRDLLVVDHYAIDERWERIVRPLFRRVLVIDDLADRKHVCDLLLDQSLHDNPKARYSGLVDPTTRLFIGPRYALLRPEFEFITPTLRNGGLRQILVYLGGTDPTNETTKILRALQSLEPVWLKATVVLGRNERNALAVRRTAAGMPNVEVLSGTNEMARLMAAADLGIGTCGGAAWERCALGLPSLVVVNAENQRDDARILQQMGAIRHLGDASGTTTAAWRDEIRALCDDPSALAVMSRASAMVLRNRTASMQQFIAALFG
jgi:UDP-2,4-diacetamido-2,4,6-trideoxy-beta-L-altropyranose hydrolase